MSGLDGFDQCRALRADRPSPIAAHHHPGRERERTLGECATELGILRVLHLAVHARELLSWLVVALAAPQPVPVPVPVQE